MNARHVLTVALLALAPLALAQNKAEIAAETGPVIVTWGQPATLPNASDYAVKIADLDANDDGRLTRREIPSEHALQHEFKLVDRDRNGSIDAEELAGWR